MDFCEDKECYYIETSCKRNENVEEAFLLMTYLSFQNHKDSVPFRYLELWNEKIHFRFPKLFRDSIFTFVVCLNLIGFGNSKKNKKNKKVFTKILPKFLLFQIIRSASTPLTIGSYIKDFSKSDYKMTEPNAILKFIEGKKGLKTTEKKKDCHIF